MTDTFASERDELADKIIEMADRVKAMDVVIPGVTAEWRFELDGIEFEVSVSLYRPETSKD